MMDGDREFDAAKEHLGQVHLQHYISTDSIEEIDEKLRNLGLVFKMDEIGLEILQIAFPAALALAADPIASLIDTAFIGHIGPVELAAVGVAIAVFNQASKITIFPLVSITTSFVAEEDAIGKMRLKAGENENLEKGSASFVAKEDTAEKVSLKAEDTAKKVSLKAEESEDLEKGSAINNELKDLESLVDSSEAAFKSPSLSGGNSNMGKFESKRRHIPSASSALVIGGILGIIQALFLIFGGKLILSFMGVKSGSAMLKPARQYLTLRSLGAPAVLLSLAMQGVFRGFKDTKTPLYATVAGDVTNIILDPILIFVCHLGVSGAAIAHVISQYLISLILLWRLMKQVDLLPPSIKDLQFSRFLKNGFPLLARVIAATFCVTLAASLAARHGSTSMAAFQICLQIWLTSSLVADGLAVAGQAILASAIAQKDYAKVTATAARVLQLALALGVGLAVVTGVGLEFGSAVFTKDKTVLRLLNIGIPFVAATQPINSLAFVFDGVNFGVSDFVYSAYSMVLVATVSIVCLFLLSSSKGFVGIWIALTIYMSLRAFAGFWRMGTGTGPWRYLRS